VTNVANSIVFQNSAQQLKTAVFGYDSSTNSYHALKVNSSGALYVISGTIGQIGTINYVNQVGTIKYLDQVGTLKYVAPIGTIKYVDQIGTLKYVAPIGTIKYVDQIGTLKYVAPIGTIKNVDQIGTLKYVAPIGTIKYVDQIGTLKYVTPIGTIKYVDQIGTLKYVAPIGTIKYVDQIGTLNYVAPIGTLKYVNQIGTLKYIEPIGTLKSIIGTVKINLVDRTFTSSTQTIPVTKTTPTFSDLIDISKYEQTSWYFRNITNAGNRATVTVQLAATPSSALSTYPVVLIAEVAEVNASPELITNNRYAKYISSFLTTATSATQTIVIVFNGRY
jgi:hypothetical protein